MLELNFFALEELFRVLGCERLVTFWPGIELHPDLVFRPEPLVRLAQQHGYANWMGPTSEPLQDWEAVEVEPISLHVGAGVEDSERALLAHFLQAISEVYGSAAAADFSRWLGLRFGDQDQRSALQAGLVRFAMASGWEELSDSAHRLTPRLRAVVIEVAQRHFGNGAMEALETRVDQALVAPLSVFDRNMYRALAHATENGSMASEWDWCNHMLSREVRTWTFDSWVFTIWRTLHETLSHADWTRVVDWTIPANRTQPRVPRLY
jgi:hypothetical protein